MPGYLTRTASVLLGDHAFQIRSLSDRAQYADPDGAAERAGISSAQWSLFGLVWPAGVVLANAMSTYAIDGRRILELGCGLGLSSLVLTRRGADITASDQHPLTLAFLDHNAGLNQLCTPSYCELPWQCSPESLGQFDLIIGSDVLYEREHATLLAALIARHTRADAEVLIADPGRGNSGRLTRALAQQGYAAEETRSRFGVDETAPFRGRLLRYWRSTATTIHPLGPFVG